MRARKLSVVGPIGVGKTSFVNIAHVVMKARAMPIASVPEWLSDLHLKLSIDQPREYARDFQTAMVTLAGVRNIMAEVLNKMGNWVIVERPIEENPIFAVAKQLETNSECLTVEYMSTFYITWVNFIRHIHFDKTSAEPEPLNDMDTTIFLWGSLPTLMTRINTRAREAELHMVPEYMKTLQALYFIWLVMNYPLGNILVVDWNEHCESQALYTRVDKVITDVSQDLTFDETNTVEVDLQGFLLLAFAEKEREMKRVLKGLFVRARLNLKGEVPSVYNCFKQLK